MTINYFTIINLLKEDIEKINKCSYCRHSINENIFSNIFLIKIASKDTDNNFILENNSIKNCWICDSCYNCIDKNSGRILEVSNKFYDRFIQKNNKNIKSIKSISQEFQVNEKRISYVFVEEVAINNKIISCNARYTFGFYHIEPIRQINFIEQEIAAPNVEQVENSRHLNINDNISIGVDLSTIQQQQSNSPIYSYGSLNKDIINKDIELKLTKTKKQYNLN